MTNADRIAAGGGAISPANQPVALIVAHWQEESKRFSKGGDEMIASPYDNVTVTLNGYDGFTAQITLQSNQKWVVQKGRRCYQLSRQGVCCKLRLTERIFNELFRIMPEDPGKEAG